MFAKYQINTSLLTATTATTINIPINMEYQIIDNAELVERLFVDVEVANSINPILDYDKVRFLPTDSNQTPVGTITYNLNFLINSGIKTPSYYSDIEIDTNDIKYRRNYFKESHLTLYFYDTDNTLTQNLITEIQIYSMLDTTDFYPKNTPPPNISGQIKSANKIPTRFILSNPLTVSDGVYEGYHIYTYKDEYEIGSPPKSLYMRAAYANAKTGKYTNLMTENTPYKIDELVNKLHTKYNLYRTKTGFNYYLDKTYSKNITYSPNTNPNLVDLSVNLYQIQTL